MRVGVHRRLRRGRVGAPKDSDSAPGQIMTANGWGGGGVGLGVVSAVVGGGWVVVGDVDSRMRTLEYSNSSAISILAEINYY